MHCIQFSNGGVVEILAFANSVAQAEELVKRCAVARVEASCGEARAKAAMVEPEGEGLYLRQQDDGSIEVRSRRVSKAEDGWFFSGTVEIVDESNGRVAAVEFDATSLHPDSSAVLLMPALQAVRPAEVALAPPAIADVAGKPWLTELKTHPKFAFAPV